MTTAIRYNTKDQPAFQKAVRQALDDYFKTTGQSIKGNRPMYLKTAFFGVWMVVGYILLLRSDTPMAVWLNYQFFGFGTLFFALTVAHDASHQALFRNKHLNKLFSYGFNLIGLSTYFWELKHHESHHSFTNVVDYDSDISPTPILRLHPRAEYRWYHRYQRWYVFLLYAIFGPLTLLIREFRLYRIHRYGNTTVQHPPYTLLRLIVQKASYIAWALVVPALVVPVSFWTVLAAFWVMMVLSGIYAIIVLAAPHINLVSAYKVPNQEGVLNTNWYNHTLETTVDCSPASRLLNWLTGGLNTHVPHHLFPNICHIHYYDLSPIIERVAKEHGVVYHKSSLWGALKSHFGLISALSQEDSHLENRVVMG